MSVKLLALRSGFTTLTVTYQYKDIILRSMVTVGAYHPLKVSYELKLLDMQMLLESCKCSVVFGCGMLPPNAFHGQKMGLRFGCCEGHC